MMLLNLWRVPDNPPVKPDCLIVLSYAVENSYLPTRPTKSAILLACRWWKKHPGTKIVMSTGDNQKLGISNAAVMAGYAEKLGIPESVIIPEDKSRTTYENLLHSREICNRKKFRQVALVMYDLHTRRALAIARKMGWSNVCWISATGPGSPAYGVKRFQTYSRMTIFVYEFLAYFYNLMKREL
jgi:uncharacterized SAM-binding protein YcdF (DUF218 family)